MPLHNSVWIQTAHVFTTSNHLEWNKSSVANLNSHITGHNASRNSLLSNANLHKEADVRSILTFEHTSQSMINAFLRVHYKTMTRDLNSHIQIEMYSVCFVIITLQMDEEFYRHWFLFKRLNHTKMEVSIQFRMQNGIFN